ncbi:MAG: Oligoendopeptidase F, plasmid [Calditrichaeota bacterium]|nr:Oligoendopeptidase F, plasmid [Calditrichota bacterium]
MHRPLPAHLSRLRFDAAPPESTSAAEQAAVSRDRIDPRYRWRLDDIYRDWDSWEADRSRLAELIDALAAFEGTLARGGDRLLACLRLSDETGMLFERVWYFPSLAFDLDQRDNEINARRQRVEELAARHAAATAFINPEILALGRDTVFAWLAGNDELALYRFQLDELFRQAEHVLDAGSEHLLALSSRFSMTPSETYSMLTTADARFPEVTLSDGSARRITPGSYSSLLRTLRVQADREKVFRAHFDTYRGLANTYASIYNGVLQRGWFFTRARNYENVLARKLDADAIPAAVVETLVDTARRGMEPLRRYHRLRRRALGVERYYLYDGFAPLVEHDRRYEYDEAADSVAAAVRPLGDDYRARAEHAFRERWVDVYETDGKRSGGYMASVYGVHPYILMNYHGTLDDVFTLAHEIGHALHSLLSNEAQPFTYAGYTIFIAEVASTLNEALLLDELLARAESGPERVSLLQHALDTIAGTFYTQSLFANYELKAHELAEAGEPITADTLSRIYYDLLTDWYADSVDHDDLYRVTWARIPHFFHSPYYVYQYATSFAASAAIFGAIRSARDETERGRVVERYLTLLRSGGSDQPMKLLNRAGVDLSERRSLDAVVARTDELVDRLERELAEL